MYIHMLWCVYIYIYMYIYIYTHTHNILLYYIKNVYMHSLSLRIGSEALRIGPRGMGARKVKHLRV